MNEPMKITRPIRFLVLSLSVAFPFALLFTHSLTDSPWLISIPILLGSLLVVVGEFWEEIASGLGIHVTSHKEVLQHLKDSEI